jgi:hypothetical protein
MSIHTRNVNTEESGWTSTTTVADPLDVSVMAVTSNSGVACMRDKE